MSAQYLLNSLGWSLGGAIVSSLYWRIYFHRKLIALGAASKEPPLIAFTAVMVIAISCMGLLFGEANRIQFESYVDCQARIAQNNVDTINDRTRSAISQLQSEITFYNALALVLEQPPSTNINQKVLVTLEAQIDADQARLAKIQNNPLQPVSDCHRPTH